MAFGTVSDPLLAAALWTGCGALVATAVLLGTIIVVRVRLLERLKREQRVAARWNPLLAECAEHVPDPLPALPARDAEAFLVLWCRAQESLRGKSQDHLREMARRLGAVDVARQFLRSGKLRLELLALVTLGHLREQQLAGRLQLLLAKGPTVVSLTAAQALIRIDGAAAVPRVLAATALRTDWPLARVVSMLRECDPRSIGPTLSAAIGTELRKDPAGDGVARLLRLHVAAHGEALHSAVLEALSKAHSVDALAAALGALWHPQDVSHARRLLGHAAWPVRVAAAKALGRFGGPADLAALRAALGDRDWWVRYRAAQALCALPQVDRAELAALPGQLTDRFAADMLRQALAERGTA